MGSLHISQHPKNWNGTEESSTAHFKQIQEQIESIHNDWRTSLDIAGGETRTSESNDALQDPERAGSGLTLVNQPTRHNHTHAFIVPQSSSDYHRVPFSQGQSNNGSLFQTQVTAPSLDTFTRRLVTEKE